MPAPWQETGGAESWAPKNSTYGWSGKTLQPSEAAVALQPSLSSLSRLTLVTARPLGTLEGEKGTSQAQGDRPPPNAPQDPVHGTRDAPVSLASLTGMPRAPAGPAGPMGPCAPCGEKSRESEGARSSGCPGGSPVPSGLCEPPASQHRESAAAGAARHLHSAGAPAPSNDPRKSTPRRIFPG